MKPVRRLSTRNLLARRLCLWIFRNPFPMKHFFSYITWLFDNFFRKYMKNEDSAPGPCFSSIVWLFGRLQTECTQSSSSLSSEDPSPIPSWSHRRMFPLVSFSFWDLNVPKHHFSSGDPLALTLFRLRLWTQILPVVLIELLWLRKRSMKKSRVLLFLQKTKVWFFVTFCIIYIWNHTFRCWDLS